MSILGKRGRKVIKKPRKRRRAAFRKPRPIQRGEVKFFDFAKAITTMAVTGILTTPSCCLVAQGTDESERIGKRIQITNFLLRGIVKIPSSVTIADTANRVRIMVFYDKQANNNAVAVTGTKMLSADSINKFRNLDNTRRFQILFDEIILLKVQSGGGDGTSDRLGETQEQFFFAKKCSIPINYDSTAGAITELTEGNIGIICWGDTFTTTAPQIEYSGRIRYTDS